MIYEINQIRAWLGARFDLHAVPDGTYEIPLGVRGTPTRVDVRGGRLFIDPRPEPGVTVEASP